MKKDYYESYGGEIAAISEKCDEIVRLLEAVLDSPDFLIERLRASVERQHRSAAFEPRMELVRHDD